MKKDEEYDFIAKILIIGDSQVGKSSIISRYIHNSFSPSYSQTIGIDFALKNIQLNNKKVKIQVWDSSGEEKFRRIIQNYYRVAEGFILVFDITNLQSFHSLSHILNEIREKGPNKPIFLVGCKSDLSAERKVQYTTALDFVKEHGLLNYIEVSALSGDNIESLFETLIQTLILNQTIEKSISKTMELAEAVNFSSSTIELRTASLEVDQVFGDIENMFSGLGFCISTSRFAPHVPIFRKFLFALPLLLWRSILYLFCLIFMLLIVLPAFFLLLVLRTKVVEIDTTRFNERQEILEQETRAKKSLRWVTLITRSIPLAFLLIAWPTLIVYYLIPKYGIDDKNVSLVVQAAIGSHLALIIGLQLLGTLRNSQKVKLLKESNQVFTPNQFRWKNLRNWVAIITIFVECIQMFAWPLQEMNKKNVSESQSDNVLFTKVFPAFFLILSENLYAITFYFALIVVALLILSFTYQLMIEVEHFSQLKQLGDNSEASSYFFYGFVGAVVYGHGILKNVSGLTSSIISFLSDTLFMIVCNKLLTMIACIYSDPGTTGILEADTKILCWQGTHPTTAFLALVGFSYYIPLCVMISPMFIESGQQSKDLKFLETYIMISTLTKCAMLVFSAFFSRNPVSMIGASMVLSSILLIVTLWWSMRSKPRLTLPCSIPFFNGFKCFTYSLSIWAACCALIREYVEFFQTNENDFLYLLFGGALVQLILVSAWWIIQYIYMKKKGKGFQRLQNQEEVELHTI